MYTYSIMPMKPSQEKYFDEICADIREQYESGVSSCPLFKMNLVPEGNPVTDKVGPLCKLYRRYREALAPYGVKTGVLIQASLGHGYRLALAPFTQYVNISDGKVEHVYCPEDENFLAHFSDVIGQIAAEHPDAIMLDDDFRLAVRPGRGCACHLHMQEFNRRTGLSMTREELYEYLNTHPKDDPITVTYLETQRDSLIKAAKRFRAAIDAHDPKIQGINCTSGDCCDSVVYTSRIFAGEGNPSIVRVPNGTYAPLTVRGFSATMRDAAVRTAKVKNNGVDIVIAETDTVPFNRYAKNARYLHSHYLASMIDGYKGAKHWLTRQDAYEPDAGKAYRKILAEHRGMYEALASLADEIRWVGCGSLFKEQEYPFYRGGNFRYSHPNEWASCVLERLGIPFYFTDKNTGAAFLEADIVTDLTDADIDALFASGSVFLDGESAAALVDRGYGDKLGVALTPWEHGRIMDEAFDAESDCMTCTAQKNARFMTVTSHDAEPLSYNYDIRDGKFTVLAPAVTSLKRDNGKLTVVFCGSPRASFTYTEGFAFLNETRKKQLSKLLSDSGNLPVYYPGDIEMLMRAGYLNDGRLLVGIWNIGFDPLEELDLVVDKLPTSVKQLMKDGSFANVDFTASGDRITVATRVEPMYPVVLTLA